MSKSWFYPTGRGIDIRVSPRLRSYAPTFSQHLDTLDMHMGRRQRVYSQRTRKVSIYEPVGQPMIDLVSNHNAGWPPMMANISPNNGMRCTGLTSGQGAICPISMSVFGIGRCGDRRRDLFPSVLIKSYADPDRISNSSYFYRPFGPEIKW